MKTISKEYKVYNYNELSETAKEKVRQNFLEHHSDSETDFMKEDFLQQIEEKYPFFSDVSFIWSLSYCQGDGLSFSGNVDIEKFMDIYFSDMRKSFKNAISDYLYNVHSSGNTGHYTYASKNDIDFDYNYGSRNEVKRIDNLANEVIEKLKNAYIDICGDFEKQGYKCYEYLGSDEYARETSEANEYTYLENGTMFNE